MNRKRLILFIILIFSPLALSSCGAGTGGASGTAVAPAETAAAVELPALEPAVITLLLAGDKPPDEQAVLDEVALRTKDELNITIKTIYTPWSDYQDKHIMMASAGDEFDIFLNFSFDIFPAYTRGEAIDVTDLLTRYGPDITKNISSNDMLTGRQNGRQVAIPAVYTKDSIALTAVVRKDLREKYHCPPISGWDTLSQFYDAILKNEPGMIPLASDGYKSTTFLSGAIHIPYRPIVYDANCAFAYVDDGGDAYKVQCFFDLPQERQLMQLGRQAYANKWFETDVLSQANSEQLFESGKAASWNVDFYNFNTIEANLKAAVPGAEMEWCILNGDDPIDFTKSNNYSQISSTSKHPERAVMFLNWLLEDQQNYDLFFFGIEGVHYTLDGDLIRLPDGIGASNNPYAPCPWFLYNTKYHRMFTTDTENTVSANEYFKNAPRNPVKEIQLAFTFNQEPVSLEIGQVDKVVTDEWYPLVTGVRYGDEAYQNFRNDLDEAGMQAIIAEYQRQLDEYITENPGEK